jgi:hypothetical protein
MQFEQTDIAPDKLLLDPNNYRFLDLQNYRPVTKRSRYAEQGVQERALALLQNTDAFELDALKDSIVTNGFVPLERIVVEKFEGNGARDLYLVVEGNRRVAAVQSLLAEQVAGATDIPEEILTTMQNLPAIVITGTTTERNDYKQTLMAIRHIAGIREWGPYQQAKLIVELFDKGQQFNRVAKEIGISAREVARRYRASKALQQMEDDEEFGEYAHPKLYALFHEAVAQPKVREWLEFSDEDFTAHNVDARRCFYELLSPRKVDEETRPPKLITARDVRQLKDIVDKPPALRVLLDPERPLQDAVLAAEAEDITEEEGTLESSLSQALHSLRRPPVNQWLAPTPRAKEIWREFTEFVDQLRPLIARA